MSTAAPPAEGGEETLPSVVAIEADTESLLLGWPDVTAAVSYELQMCKKAEGAEAAQAGAKEGGHDEAGEWTTLSSALKTNMVRKKNLQPNTPYIFRVRARDKVDWLPFSAPATVHTASSLPVMKMAAPRLDTRGHGFVAVAWEPVEGAEKYRIEMRKEREVRWAEIGAVAGTSVKKKNLQGGVGYHFRVRPVGEEIGEESEWAWSGWSDALAPMFLAPALKNLLSAQLLKNEKPKEGGGEGEREGEGEGGLSLVPAEELAGKVVAVYASAHWCGPCRNFTPLLAQFYCRMKALGRPFEIVFASVDQEEEAMKDYFAKMPWLALPFDSNEREDFLGNFEVKSIPRLLIFGTDGRLLESNAVGQTFLTDAAFASWLRGDTFNRSQGPMGGHAHGGGGGGGGGGGCC